MMKKLKGFQKKYLRGMAHHMKPLVFIGQKGITDSVIRSVDDALKSHELIKIKFIDFKEKNQKKEIAEMLENKTACEMVELIGHMAVFYRQHNDPKKRKIKIPEK